MILLAILGTAASVIPVSLKGWITAQKQIDSRTEIHNFMERLSLALSYGQICQCAFKGMKFNSNVDSANAQGGIAITSPVKSCDNSQVLVEPTPSNSYVGSYIIESVRIQNFSDQAPDTYGADLQLIISQRNGIRIDPINSVVRLTLYTETQGGKAEIVDCTSVASSLPSRLSGLEVFDYSSTAFNGVQYFSVRDGVNNVVVEAWGGGGGGGGDGCQIGSGDPRPGGGGGGGAFASGSFVVTPRSVIRVIVGKGGKAGTTGTPGSPAGKAGEDGGTSSFGNPGNVLVRAAGGRGGLGTPLPPASAEGGKGGVRLTANDPDSFIFEMAGQNGYPGSIGSSPNPLLSFPTSIFPARGGRAAFGGGGLSGGGFGVGAESIYAPTLPPENNFRIPRIPGGGGGGGGGKCPPIGATNGAHGRVIVYW